MVKGAAISFYYWNDFRVVMLLKYFPIAFLITDKEIPLSNLQLGRMDKILTNTVDETSEINVDLFGIPQEGWPENPGHEGMMMYNDKVAFAATPRTRK